MYLSYKSLHLCVLSLGGILRRKPDGSDDTNILRHLTHPSLQIHCVNLYFTQIWIKPGKYRTKECCWETESETRHSVHVWCRQGMMRWAVWLALSEWKGSGRKWSHRGSRARQWGGPEGHRKNFAFDSESDGAPTDCFEQRTQRPDVLAGWLRQPCWDTTPIAEKRHTRWQWLRTERCQ